MVGVTRGEGGVQGVIGGLDCCSPGGGLLQQLTSYNCTGRHLLSTHTQCLLSHPTPVLPHTLALLSASHCAPPHHHHHYCHPSGCSAGPSEASAHAHGFRPGAACQPPGPAGGAAGGRGKGGGDDGTQGEGGVGGGGGVRVHVLLGVRSAAQSVSLPVQKLFDGGNYYHLPPSTGLR